jgi:hypothetical protein
MPREKIVAALRRLEPRTPLERLRAASGRLRDPALREALGAGWRAARRRPEAVLAAVLVTGVAVMVLHWS